MKYIIELPEDYYKAIKEIPIKQSTTDMLIIRNGTPLSEELEAIKAEFEEIECVRDNPYNNETEYSVSMEELRELFDKHIAELKGGAE